MEIDLTKLIYSELLSISSFLSQSDLLGELFTVYEYVEENMFISRWYSYIYNFIAN